MTNNLAKQLKEYGHNRLDLEYLIEEDLPQNIWTAASEKNLKRQRANFVITRVNSNWIVTLSVTNDTTHEVYILHRAKAKQLVEAVGLMILLLEQHKLLGPTI